MKTKDDFLCFDVIVLGGGAGGTMCASCIKGKSVAIVDSASYLAKKLMVTGNGRCNLTNKNVNSSFYNQNIDGFLKRFDENQTLKYFESLGLVTFSDEEGRVYPLSNSAKSVIDVLNFAIKDNVKVFCGEKIRSVEKVSDGFVVSLENKKLKGQSLVVATGGGCQPLLKDLGVALKEFVPSLVSLKSSKTRDLNGVRVSNVLVTAENSVGEKKAERGEVLFRENGLSGIVVFNLSTIFSRINDFKGKVSIDLLPDESEEDVEKVIKARKGLNVQLDKLFVGMFVGAVANEIFKQAKVNTNQNSLKLSDDNAKLLAKTIKHLRFDVDGHLDNNQVYSGGVGLEELTENLMHKKTKNLYFVGEVCDVDGVCGGYNLQWAWTSGHIVGDSLC